MTTDLQWTRAGTEPSPSRISWKRLRQRLSADWKPGEHFSIIGPTGWGKSYLATRGLLPLWSHTLILDVKGDDETLMASGHRKVARYPSRLQLLAGDDPKRYRIAPGGYSRRQRPLWDQVFREVWRSGKGPGSATWVVYVDEARLMADSAFLGLKDHLDAVWISGRSRGITLVAGTQAPRWVPASMYEQPRYFAIGKIRDRRALDRLGQIGGDVDMIREVVPNLRHHEWLFLAPDWSAVSILPGRRGG